MAFSIALRFWLMSWMCALRCNTAALRAAVCSCLRLAAGVSVLLIVSAADTTKPAYRVATGNRNLVELLVRINELVLSIIDALRSDGSSVDVVPVRARCRGLDVSNSCSGLLGGSPEHGTAYSRPFMTSPKTRPDSGGGHGKPYAQLGTWRGRASRGHSRRACRHRRSPSWLGWPLRGAGSVVSTRRGIHPKCREPGNPDGLLGALATHHGWGYTIAVE